MVQLVQPGQSEPMEPLDPRPASQLAQVLPLELAASPEGQIRSTVSPHVPRQSRYSHHQM